MRFALLPIEKAAIVRIAERLSESRRVQLLRDLENATVEVISPERTIFHIAGYQRPPYEGQHSFGVGGRLYDSDGVYLDLDLYADQNGRLLELELLREGVGEVLAPRWDTLELF